MFRLNLSDVFDKGLLRECKHFIDSYPTWFGKRSVGDVCSCQLDGRLWVRDGGDSQGNEVAMSVGVGQDKDWSFF